MLPHKQSISSNVAVGKILIVFLGIVGTSASQLLIATILPADVFGVFIFFLTVATTTAIVLNFGLGVASLRIIPKYLAEGNLVKKRQFVIFTGLWAIMLSFVLIVISLLIPIELKGVDLFYVSGFILLTSLWLWSRYVYLANDSQALAILPRDVILPIFVLCYVFLLKPSDITQLLTFYLFLYAVCIVPGCIELFRRNGPLVRVPSMTLIRDWFNTSSPMMVTTLFQFGATNFDILVIGFLQQPDVVGTYAIISRICLFIGVPFRVNMQLYANRVSYFYSKKKFGSIRNLLNQSNILTVIMSVLLLSLVCLLFFRNLSQMFGVDDSELTYSFLVLAFGQFVYSLGSQYQIFLNMMGQERYISKIVSRATVVYLFALCIFVHIFGVFGAAASTATYFVSLRVVFYVRYRRMERTFEN